MMIFLIMTYKEKYYDIINTGLKEKPETGYYEGHHIVPKSKCQSTSIRITCVQKIRYLIYN